MNPRIAWQIQLTKFPRWRSGVIANVMLQKMSKFLRQTEFRGFLREATYDETTSNRCSYFEPHPNFLTGFWAYIRKALPTRCDDISKINFYGCENGVTRCGDSCLGIASVWAELPPNQGQTLVSCDLQQAFMVDLAHRGLLAASKQYNFDFQSFEIAKKLTEENHFRFEYQIGKTKTSPDRRLNALIWCYYDDGFKNELVLRNRDNTTSDRIRFGRANELAISRLKWINSDTVRISTKDFNDSYWICTTDGAAEFHFGLADSDLPHHIYRHACILLDGLGVLPDVERGMTLLHRAADMGYKHAQRRIEKM